MKIRWKKKGYNNRLMFKSIVIKDGRIKSFELYPLFKSLYEENERTELRCNCNTLENQEVMESPGCVSTYAPSVGRYAINSSTMRSLAEALVGAD